MRAIISSDKAVPDFQGADPDLRKEHSQGPASLLYDIPAFLLFGLDFFF